MAESSTEDSEDETFRWSGRPTSSALAALILIIFALSAFFLLPSPSDGILLALFTTFRLFVVAFSILGAVAIPLALRRRTFIVDRRGVRLRGMFRANFDVRWEEVERVEVGQADWVTRAISVKRTRVPRTMAFVGKDGSLLASYFPVGVAGVETGGLLMRATLERAARQGVEAREVAWKKSLAWSRRRKT